jgi:hypothetical protein
MPPSSISRSVHEAPFIALGTSDPTAAPYGRIDPYPMETRTSGHRPASRQPLDGLATCLAAVADFRNFQLQPQQAVTRLLRPSSSVAVYSLIRSRTRSSIMRHTRPLLKAVDTAAGSSRSAASGQQFTKASSGFSPREYARPRASRLRV